MQQYRRQQRENEPMGDDTAQMPRLIDQADGPAPAQFMAEQVAGAVFSRGMADPHGGNRQGVAHLPHRAAHFIVIGKMVGESGEAAHGIQSLAAQRDRGAETGRSQAQRRTQHRIGQECVGGAHRRQRGPERMATPRRLAGIEAGHDADTGPSQRRRHLGQPERAHCDIAIRQDQGVVPGQRQHVDQVGNLGIGAIQRGIGHDGGIGLRILGLQALHHGDRRIGFVMHTENDLDRTVIGLGEKGLEIFGKVGLAPVQRLQDGDGRAVARGLLRRLHEAIDQGRGQHCVTDADHGNGSQKPADISKDPMHRHVRGRPAQR